MSNHSLVQRVQELLTQIESNSLSAAEAEPKIRASFTAIEGLPYSRIQSLDSLAMDLEYCAWEDDEGLVPRTADVIRKIRNELSKVPNV